jgi:hypothetical protein
MTSNDLRWSSPIACSVPFLFQKFLHFQRGHAAGTSGGDGLAVAAVLHVATGEHARHFVKTFFCVIR